ncbi:MAG: hypothetical protein VX737_01540 [Pseudomonadota bacterium]|nr:hypothetical protein [Pseudomonadota bacterium]
MTRQQGQRGGVLTFLTRLSASIFAMFLSLFPPTVSIASDQRATSADSIPPNETVPIADVINGYQLAQNQKESLHALVELLQKLFPSEFPSHIHGQTKKDREDMFVDTLRPYCDRGAVETVAHTSGPEMLKALIADNPKAYISFINKAFRDADDLFPDHSKSSLSQGDRLLLVVPGGHLMRDSVRNNIAREVIKAANTKKAEVEGVIFLPGVRSLYPDEIAMILGAQNTYPELYEEIRKKFPEKVADLSNDEGQRDNNQKIYKEISESGVFTEKDISQTGFGRFSKDLGNKMVVSLIESKIHKELYPEGQKQLDRATTRDNAAATADWMTEKGLPDDIKVVLCIDLPFRERMKNVFASILGLTLKNHVLATNGTTDTAARMKAFLSHNKKYQFALVNQIYSIAREHADLTQIKSALKNKQASVTKAPLRSLS